MTIATVLIIFIAILHVYFFILESFLWTKPIGLKTFRQTIEKARVSKVLAANQGVYNAFLSAGLIWGLVEQNPDFSFQIKIFFLTCIIIAGIVGGLTSNKKILIIQAVPAAVALVFLNKF